MTFGEILQLMSAACAIIACVCAVVVAVRAQRWRDTDEARTLLDRIDGVESRLDKLEPQVAGLATKADIASLKGELDGLCALVNTSVIPGLRRIEGYMMEKSS